MNSRIPITSEIRQILIAHKERTGVSVDKLLAGRRKELPPGLNAAIINSWIRGKTHSARNSHLQYVLGLYSSLPDNPWIDLDNKQLSEIIKIGKALHGRLKSKIRLNPLPDGLTYHTLHRILSGQQERVRKLNLDYIYQIAE